MKTHFSPEDLEETLHVARDYLQGSSGGVDPLAHMFAAVLVQLSGSCVMGLPCAKHGGVTHGREAEELRAGIERIIPDSGAEVRRSLISLLDRIDARDSLAFREVADEE